MILLKENFLNANECDYLIDFYKNEIDCSFFYEANKTNPLNVLESNNYVLDNILDRIKKVVYLFYKNLQLDTAQIVRWPVGSSMDTHRDPPRDVLASLVYLNDNYQGGETYFQNVIVSPKKGNLIVFSNHEHLHGVNKIIANERYTLATWFTK